MEQDLFHQRWLHQSFTVELG